MSLVESLSWHTAASDEIIDVEDVDDDDDDIHRTELALKNNNNDGSVSDNYESSKFIELPSKSVNKVKTQINCKNDSFRWTAKTESNLQLKIPWIIILISVIQVSGMMKNTLISHQFIATISTLQIVVHYAGCDNTINALIFTPTKKHEFWRYFTYDFLHSGSVHLYSNVFLQVIFPNVPADKCEINLSKIEKIEEKKFDYAGSTEI